MLVPHNLSIRSRSKNQGFTLIELLVVIAIILILAGITFGISRGVQNAQARAKAKAELAVISQALEQFKSANGDYPWTTASVTTASVELTKSLMGWKKFVRSGTSVTFEDKDTDEVSDVSGPKSFIDPSKLSTTGTIPTSATIKPTDLKLTDPWGNDYVYLYKTSSTGSWDNFGYVLYSKGSDGTHTPLGSDGIIETTDRNDSKNIDNIYAGE